MARDAFSDSFEWSHVVCGRMSELTGRRDFTQPSPRQV
jgi:hypothetical protein